MLLLSYAILHVLAIHGVKWVDGSLPVGEFTQTASDTFYIVFGLFSYVYLVHASGKAMGRFRPAMEATGEEVEAALEDLKTMPQRVAVIAAVVGGGVGIALISEPEAFDYATTSVASTIVIGVASAMSFGMQVLAYDVVRDASAAQQSGFEYTEIDRLLREADYVSLHVPLTEATRGLIDRAKLRLMKKTACIINAARGGVGIVEELMAEHVARGGMLVMTSHHEVSMHRTAVHRLNLSA